jgi:hypothetical protein
MGNPCYVHGENVGKPWENAEKHGKIHGKIMV